MRRGLPCTARMLAAGGLEREVILERAKVRFDLVARHPLSPVERGGAFGALLVGLVDAAAVAGLEADALVVIAHEARDAAIAHKQSDLVRRGPVADEVAEARSCDSAALDIGEDRLECRQVAVHVGEDSERLVYLDGLHAGLPF